MKLYLAGLRLPGNMEAKVEKIREELYKKTKISTARMFFPFFAVWAGEYSIEKYTLEKLRDTGYKEWQADGIKNIGKSIILTGSPQDAWTGFCIKDNNNKSPFLLQDKSALFLAEARTEEEAEEAAKSIKNHKLIAEIRTRTPVIFLAKVNIYNPQEPFSAISWEIEWQKTAHKHKNLIK